MNFYALLFHFLNAESSFLSNIQCLLHGLLLLVFFFFQYLRYWCSVLVLFPIEKIFRTNHPLPPCPLPRINVALQNFRADVSQQDFGGLRKEGECTEMHVRNCIFCFGFSDTIQLFIFPPSISFSWVLFIICFVEWLLQGQTLNTFPKTKILFLTLPF